MISGHTLEHVYKILYTLLQHPEGLTVKEIAEKSDLSPTIVAEMIIFMSSFSEKYGLTTDEELDLWDGEDDYTDFLINSSQRWYIDLRHYYTNKVEKQIPVEFTAIELTLLAQLTTLTGDRELRTQLEKLLGYLPGRTPCLPVGGICRDRHWQVISQCLKEARKVRVVTISNKKEKCLTLIPLALVLNQETGFWYLIARWKKSDQIFRLDRLVRAEAGEKLPELPPFDLQQFIGRSWGIMRGKEEKVEVLFRDEARVLAKAFKRLQLRQGYTWEKCKDGRQRYSDVIAGVEEMLPWLRGFGSSVEIKRPKWVRKKLLADAKKLIEYYS